MLNIISRSLVSKHNRGPRKVVVNLLKGLDELGYPYVVNQALDSTSQLWIHDDPAALKASISLPASVAVVAGPNIHTLLSEIPAEVDLTLYTWIHPCQWVKELWEELGMSKTAAVVWPVGIDTKEFTPSDSTRDIILVYRKQRSQTELDYICSVLEACGEKFEVITYGTYKEHDYQNYLERAKAIIWLGRSESQGIGLQEALSTGVPALVCDVTHFGQWTGAGHERFTPEQLAFTPVTAAPYFDERCGIKITDLADFPDQLAVFLSSLETYRPEEYVQQNLSLAKQANEFLAIYKTGHQVTTEMLKDITRTNDQVWKNATWQYRYSAILKDAVRRIIR